MARLVFADDVRAAACLVILLLMLTFKTLAAGESAPEGGRTPSQEYEALVDAYRQARDQFEEAYRAAGNDEQRKAISETLGRRSDAQAFFGQFLRLVQRHPSDPAALEAFLWIISRTRNSSEARQAADALSDDLIRSEHMVPFCRRLGRRPGPVTKQLLERIMEINLQREVQGYARYGLAQCYRKLAEAANDTPQQRALHVAKAAELLSEVAQGYGDLELQPGTVGKRAEAELFELCHLGIGQPAPEIEGKDLDGRLLRLSDYRGKVVLLVFSGFSWCGPCRKSLVHEKELMQRLKGKPFAVIGVYQEEDRQWLRDFLSEEAVSWRAWWDDPADDDSLSRRWNVHRWPTMYLLNHKGVIRYKGDELRSTRLRLDEDGEWKPVKGLDEGIDALLEEL